MAAAALVEFLAVATAAVALHAPTTALPTPDAVVRNPCIITVNPTVKYARYQPTFKVARSFDTVASELT